MSQTSGSDLPWSRLGGIAGARVVVVHDGEATEAFQPRGERLRGMVRAGLTNLAGQPSVGRAWRALVSTQDVLGLKVYTSPGPQSGTRPAVVGAVVESLLEANIPARQIIIWDRHLADLRQAGFEAVASRYGVRLAGSAEAGYDEAVFYDTPLLGHLVWGDVEFGRSGEGIGRKSFVSRLLTKEITKMINITPLFNHNSAGVAGNLYGLAMGSVDNTLRFEADASRLATAVPEICALPALGDRVALNIVDALICQYQGEQRSLLHYSTVLNELRFSKDPVALDVLSLQELDRQRKANGQPANSKALELYQNASALELGISDAAEIQVERVP